MYKRTASIATAFAAIGILLLGVSTASANRLSVDDRTFRGSFAAINVSAAGSNAATCPMTLAGTFHSSTIAKVARSLIGHITTASLGRCSTGGATILRETLPWHVTYRSFTGTLPNITAMATNIVGLSMSVQVGGETCLLRTTTTNPWTIIEDYFFEGGRLLWILLQWEEEEEVELSGGFFCTLAGRASIEGIERQITDSGGAQVRVALI